VNVDGGAGRRRFVKLLQQQHERLGGGAVEIDPGEVEAAAAIAELPQGAIERIEDRPVEGRHVLGIGFALDPQVMAGKVERDRRCAVGGFDP
jgi:hypothetical protein